MIANRPDGECAESSEEEPIMNTFRKRRSVAALSAPSSVHKRTKLTSTSDSNARLRANVSEEEEETPSISYGTRSKGRIISEEAIAVQKRPTVFTNDDLLALTDISAVKFPVQVVSVTLDFERGTPTDADAIFSQPVPRKIYTSYVIHTLKDLQAHVDLVRALLEARERTLVKNLTYKIPTKMSQQPIMPQDTLQRMFGPKTPDVPLMTRTTSHTRTGNQSGSPLSPRHSHSITSEHWPSERSPSNTLCGVLDHTTKELSDSIILIHRIKNNAHSESQGFTAEERERICDMCRTLLDDFGVAQQKFDDGYREVGLFLTSKPLQHSDAFPTFALPAKRPAPDPCYETQHATTMPEGMATMVATSASRPTTNVIDLGYGSSDEDSEPEEPEAPEGPLEVNATRQRRIQGLH